MYNHNFYARYVSPHYHLLRKKRRILFRLKQIILTYPRLFFLLIPPIIVRLCGNIFQIRIKRPQFTLSYWIYIRPLPHTIITRCSNGVVIKTDTDKYKP